MDMNISKRKKKILLMFLGVGVFAAGYFFGYRPQMEEAQSIQASTEPLKTRLDDLLKLAADRDFYLKETEDINAKVSEYTSAFPADIRPEDGIVLSMNMENSLDMQISNVGLGTREFVASLDGSTEDPLADLPDQTLSEQANDQTQSQLDEIEGTDVIGEKERQAASDAEVENLNNVFTSPVLYRTQDTTQFTGTYASLTLDNVNASFDSSTGNLSGSITVNLFFMAGTDQTYTEPDAGSVAYGTDNIFGTIESGKKSKKSKKNKKKAAETNTEQVASDTGADGQTTDSQEGANTQDAAAAEATGQAQ